MPDPITIALINSLARYYTKRVTRSYDSDAGAALVYSSAEETGKIEEINFVESRREEEFIGQDPPRRCDNRKSRSEAKFMIRATRRWRHQYVIQTDKIRTGGATATLGLDKVVTAGLQLKLEQAMHETVSATDEVERTFEQSFEVTVPPGMLQTVTLAWKKIWQVGYIKLLVDGRHVEVPYRVLEGIDYDQVHETIS